MSRFAIRAGVAAIPNGDSGWFILDETGQRYATSLLTSELIRLIGQSCGDEDDWVTALASRFPSEQVYYVLIQLEKQGVIVRSEVQPESPAVLFRSKIHTQEHGSALNTPRSASPLSVRVLSLGGTEAGTWVESLARSPVLAPVECVPDWQTGEMATEAVYVVVTPDYLEPDLDVFGRLAHARGLQWLPVKPCGVMPWLGPLFLPSKTGCLECLLDRLRGHRQTEWVYAGADGTKRALRLSVGQTEHSTETVTGWMTVELERMATGGISKLEGALYAFDFRTISLARHPLTKREQCPVCGTRPPARLQPTVLPQAPLTLCSRKKADYSDGGERTCSAADTLERYAHLISPITGVVAQLAFRNEIPACFGPVINSSWIVRGRLARTPNRRSARGFPVGLSTGKGQTLLQAQASALGEAVERYCSQHEGYELHVRASFEELDGVAIHPYALMNFSEQQYREREVWRRKGGTAHVPDPYEASRPIDWTPAWSLTQKCWRLIPSAFTYYEYPPEGGGDICLACSNGVAAGNCLEEAIMQGFLELVERDAMAMWWYHKLGKPAVDWCSFGSPFVAGVGVAMKEFDLHLEILDLTNDLGIPVFSAHLFDFDKGLRFKANGLGCHLNPRIALERAVSELGQSWERPVPDEHGLESQRISLSREQFLRADLQQRPKVYSDFQREQRSDFFEDIEDVRHLLEAKGLELLVVDLTRPDIGFPVARVIAPGLVHFWPRFGCRRLFEVPKAAGWIAPDTDEDDLNPVPFYR